MTSHPEHRPCERYCPSCRHWKHYSRFRSWVRRYRSTSTRTFAEHCKDCEQIIRNERLNADRPLGIMRRRATNHARKLGVSFTFLWVNMNWRALVPLVRAMMTPEGLCLSCGHPFVNERDIQIEHREAPRHSADWARWHARNLGVFCQSCNNGKGRTGYAQWLDDEEAKRLSNEEHNAARPSSEPPPPGWHQLSLE